MTSQVAVLNLHGAAVASDSVLTLGTGAKQRTISSMEKLFDLGDGHRVVVMLNDSAQFMGVPWAPILNEWRSSLKTPLATAGQYWDHLCGWLPDQEAYFTHAQESLFVSEIVQSIYLEVRQELLEYVADSNVDPDQWASEHTGRFVDSIVNKAIEGFSEQLTYQGASEASDRKYLKGFKDEILARFEYVFDDVPMTQASRDRLLEDAPTFGLARAQNATPQTELAFIGYGTTEIYPSVNRVRVEGIFNGRTRWWTLTEPSDISPGAGSNSMIEGFAQSDAIFAFVRGIDPSYQWVIRNAVEEAVEELTNDLLVDLEPEDAEVLQEAINAQIVASMQAQQLEAFTAPILETVAAMPPVELARMAESLVGIQALRANSANELPTVGGDIDVVVITRHAGVKWIKRQQHAH